MHFVEIEWRSSLYEQEVTLRDRLLRQPIGLTFTPDQLAAEHLDLHFGLVHNEQLVACVVAVLLTPTHAKLRQMAVDESWQGQGYGAQLVGQSEAVLHSRGVESIELNARETCHRLLRIARLPGGRTSICRGHLASSENGKIAIEPNGITILNLLESLDGTSSPRVVGAKRL